MSIPSKDFRQWADSLDSGMSVSRMSELAGLNRATLHGQIFRGQVAEKVVVNMARSLEMDPLGALSSFEQYSELLDETMAPSRAELLSQVHFKDLFGELIRRSGSPEAAALAVDLPFEDSVRSWLDTIDPGKIRYFLAEQAGITEAAISGQLALNRMTPALAVAAARHAGVSSGSGLVVTGVLTEEEGRWPPGGRLAALRSASAVSLIDVSAYWLTLLRRRALAASKDQDVVESIWEHLG
ncbi:hypothetical protein IV498_14645 [Paenarthrobacter sp. Z7-10]|uniref:hypothetical protein n=1 Tax=Paenarthrobacter sp. Z7-10 TaxID=2787635 RepID=UPI0022A94445|nr:hypothetical protein [Paenarthrobacter sp. Z7-10]MCZ2404381.1 hypothetical protein [Paenarthrobacter sp. Z7-10]